MDDWDRAVACYGDPYKLAWVKRAFEPLWVELCDDLRFAVMYNVECSTGTHGYVRNGEPDPGEPLITPFWDADSCGVMINYTMQTLLRVSEGTIMEPRALRRPLTEMCDDYCAVCNVGNMTTLSHGTFIGVSEAMAMARYAAQPTWPECPHAHAIAVANHHRIRAHLTRIAWEQEYRDSAQWELFADMPLRYTCDRAFVLIMCEWSRDSGYVAWLPREIWRMIRRMVSTRAPMKHRFPPCAEEIEDWTYLLPFEMQSADLPNY
jgi:hypothetical protein